MSVGLLQLGDGSIYGRLAVDMHLQKLDVKSMEVRDMRDEVHEVGELATDVSATLAEMRGIYATYPDPEHVFHIEVLRPRFAILLHNLRER